MGENQNQPFQLSFNARQLSPLKTSTFVICCF